MTLLQDFHELFISAAPECNQCGAHVVRTEFKYEDTDDGWRPVAQLVCANGHRLNCVTA